MKIILTESQLNRLINEQVPLGNLLDVGSNWTTDSSIPGSSIPDDDGQVGRAQYLTANCVVFTYFRFSFD